MRANVHRATLFVALIVVVSFAAGQTFQLRVQERIVVPSENAVLLTLSFDCDPQSNVYLRPYDPGLSGPILRISPDGRRTTRFALGSAPAFQEAQTRDYAIGADGEVYILAANEDGGNYVVKFGKDGKYEESTKLESPFLALRMGVFRSGEFLVTGWVDSPNAPVSEPRQPFAGIFDQRGKLTVSASEFKDDIEYRSAGENARAPKGGLSPAVLAFERAMGGSVIRAGEDGNIYLMRRTPEGPVFVLSPSGELVRAMRLKPPKDADLSDIKLARGRLAAVFLRKRDLEKGEKTTAVTVSVLDSSTGEKLADYSHQTAEIGLGLACYVPEVFTFVGADENGKLQIVRAAAR